MKYFGSTLLIIVVFMISPKPVASQIACLYAGVASGINEHQEITPAKRYQTGYFFGMDGAIAYKSLSPFVGIQYHKRNIKAMSGRFIPKKGLKSEFVKFRLGLNWNIYTVKKIATIRAKGLLSIDGVLNLDQNEVEKLGNGKVNEGIMSWAVGMGLDITVVTIDIEYEKHLVDSYPSLGKSKFDVLTLALGFRF